MTKSSTLIDHQATVITVRGTNFFFNLSFKHHLLETTLLEKKQTKRYDVRKEEKRLKVARKMRPK